MLPRQLLHYVILEPLGQGGMGEVSAAEDTRLHRKVAIKVLSTLMASDPERRQRFEREAHAIAALNHPNIVTIYAVEEADGVPFLVMELVEGKPLNDLIPAGGLPLDALLRMPCRSATPRGGTPARHHAPRPEAGQHHGGSGRPGEGARFRPRQGAGSGNSTPMM